GAFDSVGFAAGGARRDRLVPGSAVSPGDHLIGLLSPGLRSAGYSRARRVLLGVGGRDLAAPAWKGSHHSLADELLRPSAIYAPAVVELCRTLAVHGIAHITGGGIPGNPAR